MSYHTLGLTPQHNLTFSRSFLLSLKSYVIRHQPKQGVSYNSALHGIVRLTDMAFGARDWKLARFVFSLGHSPGNARTAPGDVQCSF